MRSHQRFLTGLLYLALATTLALAQERRNSPDVTILIQQQQVRFVAQRSNETLQLQIFDQNGALVYDSGTVFQTELEWSLLNDNGEAVKSGLYSYSLLLKETGNEAARVRRGHFIVDRALDRDGLSDKLWVTSQNENGVGVQLTVVQDENATVAGATIGRAGKLPDAEKTEGEQTADNKSDSILKGEALAPNTIGRLAKFIGANNELGDSIITETNGNLDVSGTMRLTLAPNSANNGLVAIGTPNSEAGVTITKDAGRADARFDGSTFKLVAGAAGGPPSNFSGIAINTSGNVGIGTTTPANKLDVQGGIRALFNNSTGVVAETTGGTNAWARFQMNTPRQRWFMGTSNNFNGDQFYLWDETANQARFTIQPASGAITFPLGNVGIGTNAPTSKLQVEGSGFIEATVKSNNERAALVLDSTVGGQRRVWTLESNLLTAQGVFGIFDRTANQPRLMIDATGLVSVKSLQISGGADLAENFDIQSQALLQPGMVVAIDQTQPGRLSLSRRAYDRRVAGVISGAGGIQPGMRMGQAETLADGQYPVALTGRVYVWADAKHGAIQPGDLLTTSATPGHAMKATNSVRATGAVLGKAMTRLKKGKGLVLVLVTLQ